MMSVAFKMLIGNKPAFLGVIFGIFLAILLISQQSAIFLGLVSRSYRILEEISTPNVWVIDPVTEGEDLIRSMPENYLSYIKSIPNIEWAMPINYQLIPLSTSSGIFKVAEVYGIDDESLVGAPKLVVGNIRDLYVPGAVIIDKESASTLLATHLPDGTVDPLKIGDAFELNGKRAVVVGIAKITPGFFPQPKVFTTHSQFNKYSGSNRIQFIGIKTKEEADVNEIIQTINSNPRLLALTRDGFASRFANHFLKTGILINFGLSLVLGLIIGFSIAGQIFYITTLHNIPYYALIKALGGSQKVILSMIVLQAFIAVAIGYILGTAVTLLWGLAIHNTTLAFEFPWQLLLFTGLFAVVICIFIASLCVRKVIKLDPHILLTSI